MSISYGVDEIMWTSCRFLQSRLRFCKARTCSEGGLKERVQRGPFDGAADHLAREYRPQGRFRPCCKLDELGLLYPDLQLIHMISSTPAEINAVAKAGCSVSFSPYTEMRTGFGIAQPSLYLTKNVRVGLSVDTTTLSGGANMFEIMKGVQNSENGLALSEFFMPAKRVVEMATIGGARSIGLDGTAGSLTPGKRAALIVIDTDAVNLGMMTNPYEMVVGAVQPSNVSTVMIDGRLLKKDGRLTALDAKRVVREASAANIAIRKRGGWW